MKESTVVSGMNETRCPFFSNIFVNKNISIKIILIRFCVSRLLSIQNGTTTHFPYIATNSFFVSCYCNVFESFFVIDFYYNHNQSDG